MNNINLFIAFSIVASASLFAAGTMVTSAFAMSHENGTMTMGDNSTMPMDNMTMTTDNSTNMTANITTAR
jgi:hypothetical protein